MSWWCCVQMSWIADLTCRYQACHRWFIPSYPCRVSLWGKRKRKMAKIFLCSILISTCLLYSGDNHCWHALKIMNGCLHWFPHAYITILLACGPCVEVCKYWFFRASICDWTKVLEWSVVRASSGDTPLISLPNVTRLKIEGVINTCLAAATRPMTCYAMRCSEAWIITRLRGDSWCQEGIWRSIYTSERSLVQT